jgi:hypothetical protein
MKAHQPHYVFAPCAAPASAVSEGPLQLPCRQKIPAACGWHAAPRGTFHDLQRGLARALERGCTVPHAALSRYPASVFKAAVRFRSSGCGRCQVCRRPLCSHWVLCGGSLTRFNHPEHVTFCYRQQHRMNHCNGARALVLCIEASTQGRRKDNDKETVVRGVGADGSHMHPRVGRRALQQHGVCPGRHRSRRCHSEWKGSRSAHSWNAQPHVCAVRVLHARLNIAHCNDQNLSTTQHKKQC